MQKLLYLGHFLPLLIEPYQEVFRTSEKDVLGTSLRDVHRTSIGFIPWHFILDLTRTRLLVED